MQTTPDASPDPEDHAPDTAAAPPAGEDAIRELVARLSRRHRSGGVVVERAALLAEGHDFDAILAWITSNGGEPEALAPRAESRGLHGDRSHERGGVDPRHALRFVLPRSAIDAGA